MPPFDDRRIIAGQGTIGLEIAADLPDVAHVLVPVGGGGCCAGIALALRAARPAAQCWAVEPTGADALCRSLEAGRLVALPRTDTIADGLRPLAPGVRTFSAAQQAGVRPCRVTDDAIRDAVRWLATRAKLVVETSGAAPVAALLAGFRPPSPGPIVCVLTGGNIAPEALAALL